MDEDCALPRPEFPKCDREQKRRRVYRKPGAALN